MGIDTKLCECGVKVSQVFYAGVKTVCETKKDYGREQYSPHTCQIPYNKIMVEQCYNTSNKS